MNHLKDDAILHGRDDDNKLPIFRDEQPLATSFKANQLTQPIGYQA